MKLADLRPPATVLACACGVAACGGTLPPPTQSQSQSQSDLPNIAQIQSAIAQSVLARDHIGITVLCPTVVPEIAGETFACIAFSPGPKHRALTFMVTEHGGTYVTYRQRG
jgi:hypothetical protein